MNARSTSLTTASHSSGVYTRAFVDVKAAALVVFLGALLAAVFLSLAW